MTAIGVDLGGTKLASAVFQPDGTMVHKKIVPLENRTGKDVGFLISSQIQRLMEICNNQVTSIGISVPGISYAGTGTVWAPNIPGWDNYPLFDEIQSILKSRNTKIKVDSDRSCYILGETWQGVAQGCKDAIFLSVGTGIGAGIMIDGQILHGSADIAGCAGWMAIDRPYRGDYKKCGCLEYLASGNGIANATRKLLSTDLKYNGELKKEDSRNLTSHDVFAAYKNNDPIAVKVIHDCIELWGMCVANLVSLFNPEMIILGGGVFGPAAQFLEEIRLEALKWAHPVGMTVVSLEISILGDDAGLIGAGRLAIGL